ncbi:hypothetical protein ABPG74_018989 [Tetrahymena malaccensis]
MEKEGRLNLEGPVNENDEQIKLQVNFIIQSIKINEIMYIKIGNYNSRCIENNGLNTYQKQILNSKKNSLNQNPNYPERPENNNIQLGKQSKEKTKNNHIEIGIVNSGTMQTIKVANKKSSDNKIEYDEKNQMILIQQDQIDKKYQKLEINLLQNDKKHLQENQIQQKQVNSNQLESQNQENFNQIDQVIQQKNPNISIIEDENNTDMQQIIILDCYQPLTEDQKSSQQLNKINQLQSSDEVTDNDTQENCNKIISEILEYKFEEFEKEDEQDQINLIYDDLSEIHYHVIQPIVNFRKWSEDKFKQSNQILSQNFIKNRDIIFKEIGDFNFLCKQFFSQDNMDLFVGYFQNNQGVICDYIYKIYYYKNTSDLLEEAEFITKYDKVKENEQCHIKISENLDPDIDFKSDIFSLGKTLQRVIEVFEKFSTDQCIQKFKKVIDDYMIQPGKISREDCLKIHELFLFTLLETNNLNEILDYYIQKIQNILELSSYDKNKDIPYILNLKLYYSLKLFYLFGIKISHNNYIKITTPFSINDSISPQITIQQNSIALNELDSNDLYSYTITHQF